MIIDCDKCRRGSEGGFMVWQVCDHNCVHVEETKNICERCCSSCAVQRICEADKKEI